jgi:hypothetical protein
MFDKARTLEATSSYLMLHTRAVHNNKKVRMKTVSVHAPAHATQVADRLFFAWLSSAVLVMAVTGFARTYILVPFMGLPEGTLPATALVHFHAAISFSWCVLLLAQSYLVVAGNVQQHAG